MTEPSFASRLDGAYESIMWFRRNQTGPRLLWIRLVLLVCFVLGQTPLLPAGVGAALWLEGSHHVELQGNSGQFRLVLHHSPAGHVSRALAFGEHQHGRISRLLVIGPTAFGAPHPDHLLSFVPETAESPPAAHGAEFKAASHMVPAELGLDILVPRPNGVMPSCRGAARPCLRAKHPTCLSTIVLLV
ncbi:MAG: hypothetical protein V4675_17410 [Verrucomicrobiota bacterium]